jgi:ABC-2 type transport system permease protein
MTTTTAPVRVLAPRRRPFAAMAIIEAKLFVREPLAMFFGLLFPAVLLLVLGSAIPGFRDPDPEIGGLRGVDIYTPVAISLAIATVALVTYSATLSVYREKGVLRRLATTPVGPSRVIMASLVVQGAALILASVLTVVVAKAVFDVSLPGDWAGAVLALLLGTTSMCAVGMLVAALAPNAKAASAIGTLVYFPMMFFAGVWTPGPTMPDLVQRIGDYLPLGAASTALQDSWAGEFPSMLHLGVMIVWTLVCGVGAAKLFRWE